MPKTKDGGYIIDEPEAGIGYKPYKKATEKKKKKTEKK